MVTTHRNWCYLDMFWKISRLKLDSNIAVASEIIYEQQWLCYHQMFLSSHFHSLEV